MGRSQMNMRRICVVTTSRADYGSLRWLMRAIEDDDGLQLQLIATGMHLSPEFGLTYREIEGDGYSIDRKIEMLLSADTDSAATKSVGLGLAGFSDALMELKPDVLVVLGDRFELLSAAIAALMAKIPIAHLHGGETSQGAIDEAVRHSVTKMSSLHFAATEEYRRRIIQMGENPDAVFAVGAPGLDALRRMTLMSRPELESQLDFALVAPTALVTYHPVTLETDRAAAQIENLLRALMHEGVRAVITKANADTEGRLINQRLEEFCAGRPADYRLYENLGQRVYLSCLRHVDMMVGNSSSGLIEAPSFGLPVVNVGDRQRGRIKADNVIDVDYSIADIAEGIRQAKSSGWRETLADLRNPYAGDGDGMVSFHIKERLKLVDLDASLLKKRFHDLPLKS